jgi:hypothetical protein
MLSFGPIMIIGVDVSQEPKIPIPATADGSLVCPYGKDCRLRWVDEKKLLATCDFEGREPCAETIPFNGALMCGAILKQKNPE